MHYPAPTSEHARRFREDGFLVIENAIDEQEQHALRELGEQVVLRRAEVARDWDWRRGEALDQRAYRIVQSGVGHLFPWLRESRFRLWCTEFSSALMHQPMEFWYEQFLAKSPGTGAPTPWHQDEAYWGRTLWDRGITCWTAFHAVNPDNGCMHFVRHGHRALLEHRNPAEMASDLLVCEIPEDAEVVACPIEAGSVTFHHSRTPHMTTRNASTAWRMALAQHFCNPACKGLPEDNYSWRVHVEQNDTSRVHQNGVIERL
ncbi:MAG TPA: phytanoyl-CoA dioxygenase family protein [Polyangiaceae bacterium]